MHDDARRLGEVYRPLYRVADASISMADLLARFTRAEFQEGSISRLTDLHLKVGEPARYRFDAELVPLPDAAPLTASVLRDLLAPLLTTEQLERLESSTPCDIDASFDLPDLELNFRINVFSDRDGMAAAIRALPRRIPTVDEVGFPDDAIWKEIVGYSQGLVLVTGITGSGKSTTIASLISWLNANRHHRIITLEDPIEYVYASDQALVSQRELGQHISSFEGGLRSALREDPDVIFVGEMRDRETTALAMTAAETGHLVLSTLHTRDTRGAISRIVDLFPPERTKEIATQLSFALNAIIGQKLVTRKDGRGRRAAMEILKISPAIGHLIRNGNWHQLYSAMETGRKDGMLTLEAHLKALVQSDEITREEALRRANQPSLASQL